MKKCTKNGLSAAVTGCYGVIALLFVVILLGGCNAESTVTPDAAGAVQWKYLYYNGSRQEIEITDSNIDCRAGEYRRRSRDGNRRQCIS